jgi:ATP-dependent DNA helicase RecQ
VTTAERARALLADFLGPDAEFRDGQLEAIEALVDRRQRVLVVQRTGWGKSIVYLIATRLLRDDGAGPSLVVSPLLALMRNQTQMGERIGVRSATINSENVDDWQAIERAARDGSVDLLLISPERLNNPRFRDNVLAEVAHTAGLFVVDEVHCISDWGHDFRPDYRRVGRVIDLLPPTVPVLGCTATANDRVVADIEHQLGDDLVVIRGPLGRDSLAVRVVDLPSQGERLAWLSREIPRLDGTGVVYCLTIADANRVTQWLRREGIDAVAYTGATEADDRLEIEAALSENRVKVVVATSALGMGYDKPDLAFVIHFQSPGSPIAYYQQIGRAGRALDTASVVLLRGHEDRDIQDWFIETAFPDRVDAEAVVSLLEAQDDPVGVAAIEPVVNVRRSRLDGMLKVLEVEGAVARDGGKWRRTGRPWAYDGERVERVTAQRRREQAAMDEFGTTDRCLMQALLGELDDPVTGPCGRCGNCVPVDEEPLDPADVARAIDFVRRQPLLIEPRRQWPSGLDGVKGRIAAEQLVEEGRALCLWTDGGWGTRVRSGRKAGVYADELVGAAAHLVDQWGVGPAWVTAVPGRPEVGVFADGLAAALGLPYVPALVATRDKSPQHTRENSAQQVTNVLGAFALSGEVPSGPVLLVDDTVSSRWTLTVAGALLRDGGAEAVFPLVLAQR